jgi:hypothetical protein
MLNLETCASPNQTYDPLPSSAAWREPSKGLGVVRIRTAFGYCKSPYRLGLASICNAAGAERTPRVTAYTVIVLNLMRVV